MALRNLRIGARLNIGFGAILGIMLLLAFGATWLGQKSRNDFAAVTSAANAKQFLAADMKALLLEQPAVMRSIGLHPDVQSMKIEADRSRRLGKEYGEARGRMKFLVLMSEIDPRVQKALFDLNGLIEAQK